MVFVCTEGQKARTLTPSSPWGSSESCGRSRPSNGCPSWRWGHLVSHHRKSSYSQDHQDKIFGHLAVNEKPKLKPSKWGGSPMIFLKRHHVKKLSLSQNFSIFVIFRNVRTNFIEQSHVMSVFIFMICFMPNLKSCLNILAPKTDLWKTRQLFALTQTGSWGRPWAWRKLKDEMGVIEMMIENDQSWRTNTHPPAPR